MSGPDPSRREFLKQCAAGAAMASASPLIDAFAQAAPKSKVVIARDAALRGGGRSIDSTRVLNMLDRAVQALYDRDTPLDAWKRVAKPGEVVGLKVNSLAGRSASTNVTLVQAVCERLQQAGIPAKDIVIWDRLNSDLEGAGFRVMERGKIRTIGNDTAGYEDDLAVYGTAGSLLSRTMTRTCNAVINLPVLKDHGIAGVTIALKNMFGAIHNPNKYHMNVADPAVADVYMLDPIREKVRLHICDATTAQYEGGPSFMPQWSWPMNAVLVARDPVALDAVGWQIIEQKRAEKGMKTLAAEKREPKYIATAADARHRIGTNDLRRIDRVEV
jgi:uncharacterized protein (DUF362 family)